jgi:hypothetical protein
MDGEMAFDMLNELFSDTMKRGERDRFDALVESLRERRPEVYAEEARYCINWLVTNALVAGRGEVVAALARELALLAGKEIDAFERVESRLAYHGQLSTLVETMRLAWPQVKSSADIVPWGIDEFGSRAIIYEVLGYVEGTPVPDAAEAALLERIEFYAEIDPARVSAYLAHLTSRTGRQWTMSDFVLASPRRDSLDDWDDEDEEPDSPAPALPTGELNLYHLTVEFLGYLRRVENMPYSKGELGRRELQQFIVDRHEGKLEYKESMLRAAQRDIDRRLGRRTPPKREFRRYEHMLVPDRERLDRFLARLLDFLNPLHYHAAAVFEIIPSWLRFLEARGLIDAEARARAVSDLADLADNLPGILESGDPAPRQACERWRAQATKALPE